MIEELKTAIKACAVKADKLATSTTFQDAGDAMKYSQAALNMTQALVVLKQNGLAQTLVEPKLSA